MKLTLYTDGRCVYSFFQWMPELLTLHRYSRSRAVPEWQASMMACSLTPGGRGFTSSLFSSSSTIMPACTRNPPVVSINVLSTQTACSLMSNSRGINYEPAHSLVCFYGRLHIFLSSLKK